MQVAGKESDSALSIRTPYWEPSPARTVHRHMGLELATIPNAEQQVIGGLGVAPVTKGRHGARGMITDMQSESAEAYTINNAKPNIGKHSDFE